MRRVDRALHALHPVARDGRHAHPAVALLRIGEGQLGEFGLLFLAEPDPDQAACLVHRKMADLDALAELLRLHDLRRRLDDAAGYIHLPAVEKATDAVAFDSTERQRRAAVRTEFIQEPDAPVGGAESDIIVAEQPHLQRVILGLQLRGERERNPVVLPHQAAHRGIAFDADHALVFLAGDHFRLLLWIVVPPERHTISAIVRNELSSALTRKIRDARRAVAFVHCRIVVTHRSGGEP